jgi:ribosomal protein L28
MQMTGKRQLEGNNHSKQESISKRLSLAEYKALREKEGGL